MVVLQQTAGSTPVHVPLIISYNQLGYEGKLGFPNLVIKFGLEIRYISGYKPDGYAPLSGQFFTQNDTTIRQHLFAYPGFHGVYPHRECEHTGPGYAVLFPEQFRRPELSFTGPFNTVWIFLELYQLKE
jgi:hypothetical protein